MLADTPDPAFGGHPRTFAGNLLALRGVVVMAMNTAAALAIEKNTEAQRPVTTPYVEMEKLLASGLALPTGWSTLLLLGATVDDQTLSPAALLYAMYGMALTPWDAGPPSYNNAVIRQDLDPPTGYQGTLLVPGGGYDDLTGLAMTYWLIHGAQGHAVITDTPSSRKEAEAALYTYPNGAIVELMVPSDIQRMAAKPWGGPQETMRRELLESLSAASVIVAQEDLSKAPGLTLAPGLVLDPSVFTGVVFNPTRLSTSSGTSPWTWALGTLAVAAVGWTGWRTYTHQPIVPKKALALLHL